MRRSATSTLIAFIVVVLAALASVTAAGWSPLLGLDLQGGVAVVLRPTTEADEGQINEAVSIIRQRVDAIGVAEPDISVQGGNVVVQLPGVKDRERALELVGSTAELRFRPALGGYAPPAEGDGATLTTDSTLTTDTTAAGNSATTAATTATTAATASTGAATSTSGEQGLAPMGTGEQALGPPRQQATTTTAAPTTTAPDGTATTAAATTDTTLSTTDTTLSTTDTIPTTPATAPPAPPVTPREQDTKDAEVVLPEYDENGVETFRWLLGPTIVTGDALVAADTQATINPSTGEWLVQIRFKDGDANVGAWRRAAAACFQGADPLVCPTGRLAAVLDGVVISAPQVNDTFQGSNEAVITGQFGQDEAQQLAQQLRYGALPVQFERQQSQDVSATIGRDALSAGVAAGLIGLAIVAIYIVLYYRLLGLVAIASLALSFAMMWSIICWLGASYGLALSLSGVVGIIVSIGVSIDSNIVYFEHLKDDMAAGRTLRSAAQRAFTGAMSTIVKANLVSLIGAGLLYFLTVGPVKGFALFLGLATLLDLVASYFFMRPAVVLLAGTDLAARNPKAFGIPAPNPVAAKAVP